jgi:cell division protein FtsZ
LNAEIGITLIATGFEHKDPFAKSETVKKPEKEEKIVITLEMPSKDDKRTQPLQQLSLLPEEQPMEQPAEVKAENIAPVAEVKEDPLMPTLVEHIMEAKKEIAPTIPAEKTEDNVPIFFEISSAADQIPTFEFDIPTLPIPEEKPKVVEAKKAIVSEEVIKPTTGFLTKPAQIYVAEEPNLILQPIEEKVSGDVSQPIVLHIQEEEPMPEMTLVVKEEIVAKEVEKEQATTIAMPNVEEPVVENESDDPSRRTLDRITKLRNLSFNINAADPNNEFETVPAYLRRNVEQHNQIANIESFYSNYTVKSDENNQAEISTINTFLDSKKPD